jgi:glycosyltransferase involved in cell wall biosynthesis
MQKRDATKKICFLSNHHLCINPRLWKEAFVFEKMGYQIVILTMWQSLDLLKRDLNLLNDHRITYKPYLNMIPGKTPEVIRLTYRIIKRVACEAQRFLKIGSGWAITYNPGKMYRSALHENADLYIVHLEGGFYVGRDLVMSGKKVAFDFEDWYSRDYLTPDRPVSLLRKLERFALVNGVYCTAASTSMADALTIEYCPNKKITTIYNTFPQLPYDLSAKPPLEIKKSEALKILWTSRTVGPERGLETLIKILKDVDRPIELHIIGECTDDFEKLLRKNWPEWKGHKLCMHGFMSHNELQLQISSYDIGLALEQNTPDSRNTTVTNKILQYLQAGIRVIATDTLGQKEIASFFSDSVFLVSNENPHELADKINLLAAQKESHNIQKQKMIYEQKISWQIQENKLQNLLNEHLV